MKNLQLIIITISMVLTFSQPLEARDSKIVKAKYKDAFWSVLANLELLRVECVHSNAKICGPRATHYIQRLKTNYDTIDHRFPGHEHLMELIQALSDAVQNSALQELVVGKSFQLERALMAQLDAVPLPAESLSRDLGKSRYDDHCAACHGIDGGGDGSLAARLRVPLQSFSASFRTATMTPLSIYAVMVSGSAGTEMTPFVEVFSQEEMWSVAFYVSSLPYLSDNQVISDDCRKLISSNIDLNQLMTLTDLELESALKKIPSCAVTPAYLRLHTTFDSLTTREVNGEIAARGSKSARGLVLLSLAVAFVSAGFIWILTRRSRVK